MKVFMYRRIGNYHEESYNIIAENVEEAKLFIEGFEDFEVSPENLRREEFRELDTSSKGVIYVSSYCA